MKNHPLSRLVALLLFATSSLTAFAGDPKTELKELVDKIQANLKAGQRSEDALKENIAEFDALLTAHKGETSDDVAQILFMKATLYTQVFSNEEKGVELLKQLQADFPNTTQAKRVAAMLKSIEATNAAQAALALGKTFPEFNEKDLDGKPLSIANYKGKVVLIDFWATWCGPCVRELPNVVAAYKKFHARGFEIIGISLDKADSRQKLIDFTKEHEMPWVQYFDGQYWDNKISRANGINSIPATFLLDGEGKIIAKDLRGPDLDAALEKALAKN
jgi:peroxiredoxin